MKKLPNKIKLLAVRSTLYPDEFDVFEIKGNGKEFYVPTTTTLGEIELVIDEEMYEILLDVVERYQVEDVVHYIYHVFRCGFVYSMSTLMDRQKVTLSTEAVVAYKDGERFTVPRTFAKISIDPLVPCEMIEFENEVFDSIQKEVRKWDYKKRLEPRIFALGDAVARSYGPAAIVNHKS